MLLRTWIVAFVLTALGAGLLPMTAAAAPPLLPDSIAAVGDSITQAASSGGGLGTDYPANSWSTGSNASVNSHYRRLLALNPAIDGQNHNRSVSGAKVAGLNAQMQQVVALQPDYVTVLIGGNDLCTDTVEQMTPVATFSDQFQTAMVTLAAGAPDTSVYVVSIPNIHQLWELFRNDWVARFIWWFGGICQSLLADPLSDDPDDVARRAAVAQRNADYNAELATVCAAALRCLFDGNAAFNTEFVRGDVAGDYFHPSIQGQAKLAAVSWAAGYWPAGAPETVSIGDLAGHARTRPAGGWRATVTVTTIDGEGAPVSGAFVSGAWSTGANGTCTTGGAGRCSFSLNLKGRTLVTWTIGSISHATHAYDPAANLETSITIARP